MLQEQRATSPFNASVSKSGLRIKALQSSLTGALSGYPVVSIEPHRPFSSPKRRRYEHAVQLGIRFNAS